MKYALLLFLIGLIYLNRSYAYFFDFLKDHPFVAPTMLSSNQKVIPSNNLFVTIGDSLLAGVCASDYNHTLAKRLFDLQVKDQPDLTLLNLAIPGAKIHDVVATQLATAIKQNPKNIVILIGINDVHDFVSQSSFDTDYRKLVTDLQDKTSAQISLINIPYLGSNLVLLPPWGVITDVRTRQYNSLIESIAKEKNLHLVDLYQLSKQQFVRSSGLYCQDQFHPSDLGYALWADYINAH